MLYSLSCIRLGGNVPSDTGGRYDATQSFSIVYPSAPNDDVKGYDAVYQCYRRCMGYNVAGTQEQRNNLNFSRVDDGIVDESPNRDKYANCLLTVKYIGRYRGDNSPLTYQINLPNQLVEDIPSALAAKLKAVWDADLTNPPYATGGDKPPYDEVDDDFVVTNAICVIGG